MITLLILLGHLFAQDRTSGTALRMQDANPTEFQNYLQSNKLYKSFVDRIIESDRGEPAQLPLDGSLSRIEENLSQYHKSIWRRQDIEPLLALYIKAYENSAGFPQQLYAQRLDSLFTLHPEFQQSYFEFWSKLTKSNLKATNLRQELTLLLKAFAEQPDKQDSVILLDGAQLKNQMLGKVTDTRHHWVFLSNVYEPLVVYGRYADFLARLSSLRPLAEGNCKQLDYLSDQITGAYEVFFDKTCVHSPAQNQTLLRQIPKEIKSDQKQRWLLPLGFLAAGAVIYSFKDYKVIVRLPSFK